MSLTVPCRDAEGNPICPVCLVPVERPGEFDSITCYTHFIMAVMQQGSVVEMEEFLDIDRQPWHSVDSTA